MAQVVPEAQKLRRGSLPQVGAGGQAGRGSACRTQAPPRCSAARARGSRLGPTCQAGHPRTSSRHVMKILPVPVSRLLWVCLADTQATAAGRGAAGGGVEGGFQLGASPLSMCPCPGAQTSCARLVHLSTPPNPTPTPPHRVGSASVAAPRRRLPSRVLPSVLCTSGVRVGGGRTTEPDTVAPCQ